MKAGNKIKMEGGMSSMTDLVFLLLIFFIIISTMVNTSHEIKLPEGSGDPSLASPVKVYVDAQNNFYLNSNPISISIGSIEDEIKKDIDKNAHRASAYEIIRIAKQNALKVVIKTKGSK